MFQKLQKNISFESKELPEPLMEIRAIFAVLQKP